jgi:hypothetical protein
LQQQPYLTTRGWRNRRHVREIDEVSAFGGESGNHAGKHIAGACGGERFSAAGVEQCRAICRCNGGVVAFQQNRYSMLTGKELGAVDFLMPYLRASVLPDSVDS